MAEFTVTVAVGLCALFASSFVTGDIFGDPCRVMPNGFNFVSGMYYGDPCTVVPEWVQLTDDGGEVTVPANCLNGSIWWNYPRGVLQVTWHHAQEFTVCLTPDIGPRLSNISQVVDNRVIPVHNPQAEGEKTCFPEADTTVVALLAQPPFLTYMTLYNFSLQFKSN